MRVPLRRARLGLALAGGAILQPATIGNLQRAVQRRIPLKKASAH
jgi:hypothetical protein